jgi:hypothetical protein
MIEPLTPVFMAAILSALGYLIKVVLDLRSDVKVLQSQRESYIRELDGLTDKLNKLDDIL